jgi:AraC family transcriptional regulator, glycine betaine-responsive activator
MAQGTDTRKPEQPLLRIGFWLTEAFDFYALASALEPLRVANEQAGKTVCEWQMLSLQGTPLRASNGVTMATQALDQAQPFDVLMHLNCVGPHGARGLIRELLASSRCNDADSRARTASKSLH